MLNKSSMHQSFWFFKIIYSNEFIIKFSYSPFYQKPTKSEQMCLSKFTVGFMNYSTQSAYNPNTSAPSQLFSLHVYNPDLPKLSSIFSSMILRILYNEPFCISKSFLIFFSFPSYFSLIYFPVFSSFALFSCSSCSRDTLFFNEFMYSSFDYKFFYILDLSFFNFSTQTFKFYDSTFALSIFSLQSFINSSFLWQSLFSFFICYTSSNTFANLSSKNFVLFYN